MRLITIGPSCHHRPLGRSAARTPGHDGAADCADAQVRDSAPRARAVVGCDPRYRVHRVFRCRSTVVAMRFAAPCAVSRPARGASCDLATVTALAARHPAVRQFIVLATADFNDHQRHGVRGRPSHRRNVGLPDRRTDGTLRPDRNPPTRRPTLRRRDDTSRRVPAGDGHRLGRPTIQRVRQRLEPGRPFDRHVPPGPPQDCWGATPNTPAYNHLVESSRTAPAPTTNGCHGSATSTRTPP